MNQRDPYTDRVIAYVTREREGRRELLVFDHRDHPSAGTQVPAGRMEPHEDLEAGLLRELEEESGIRNATIVRKLATFEPWELAHGEPYRNHAYELEVPELPDSWEHVVGGDGDDAGLVFVYRWEEISQQLELWHGRDALLEELTRRR